ncbi:MAG: HAD-IC family P-type ATPase [Actinomycetia bacterium]|nr:HAD-IC family P-type ATPase [Actinomycetes bacterium]
MREDDAGIDGLNQYEDGAWSAKSASEVTAALRVDVDEGLDADEANRRLDQVGANELAAPPRRGPFLVFLDQFRNLLIIILMVAAVVAGLIGDFKDALVIVAVLAFNALLGFYQEYRAERSLDALKGMLVAHTRVRRSGAQVVVAANELVPGDVVLLEAGDRVPADARIVVVSGAEIDESSLTGESVPVVKGVAPVTGGVVALADRTNVAFMNTVVTRGRLEVVVTDTGMRTQMGALAQMLERADPGRTPLQVQLDALGARLAIVAGIAVLVFFLLELLRGEVLSETLLNAVALAVAAIPEGLPAVVTVTLSVGTFALARRGAIVKRLASVETLGCTSVICSDKTGTLTVNQMTARRMFAAGCWFDVTGEGYGDEGAIRPTDGDASGVDLQQVLRPAVLCSDSAITDGHLIGDPTEGALLALASKAGLDAHATRTAIPRVAEVPFDSSAKFMATFHDVESRTVVLAKGAWEALVARATSAAVGADPQSLTDDLRTVWSDAAEQMAEQGLRVLAVASAQLPDGSRMEEAEGEDLSAAVDGLTLLALVGLLDPPRPEARIAIARCASAGIEVKMITGDHPATARTIATDLDIPGEVITGSELDELDDNQLSARIDDLGVFARVAPEHKVRIVKALQENRRVVAMTGDGVNDAPALKSADIGIAMGITGTEVSKEAAAMVLTDDNFATIVGAVEQGRTIYDNIVKFVRFQLSTNLGAILAMVGAPLVGLPVPFAAIQVLWINLIMDGPPAMALGVDPPQPGVMDAQPRSPSARILTSRRLVHLMGFGAVMAVGTLGVLAYGLEVFSDEEALTLAFTTFVFYQVFNVFNARNERRSAFGRHAFTNYRLWVALVLVVFLQVAIVEVDALHGRFKTTDLSTASWVTAIVVASSILLVEELRKLGVRLLPAGHQPR